MAASSRELEEQLGQQLRRLRLLQRLSQAELAVAADVSLSAVKNLEHGAGSTTGTLVRVLRSLGQEDWLSRLAPEISISPLAMMARARKTTPQRVSRTRNVKPPPKD